MQSIANYDPINEDPMKRAKWLLLTISLLLFAPSHAVESPATAPATQPSEMGWKSLFNGKDLDGWTASDFAGHADPDLQDGNIVLPMGVTLTGVTYAGKLPTMNYEVRLQAKRTEGADFFAGVTFPVGDNFGSLIVGGWGGGTCGISSLDDKDAAHNSTTSYHKFNRNQWYSIRLRVTPNKLQAWVDKEMIVDVDTTGKQIALRQDIDAGKPFSIATYQTTAALRDIQIREIKEK